MFWLLLAAIVTVITASPIIRLLVKRMILRSKIKSAVSAVGGRLIPAHKFWLFGKRMGKNCDFFIETPEKVYAVKLFTVLFKTASIVFADQGCYTPIRHIHLFGRWGQIVSLPLPENARPMPVYDFTTGLPCGAESKEIYQTLLIHPACLEIHRKTEVRRTELLYAGDVICGMHIQSLSGLLRELQNVKRKQSQS